MTDLIQQFQQSSALELVAVIFGILYLLLAVKEHIACWAAAIVSTLIFLYIFFDVKLYMEAALQIYYLAMAVYGWHTWRNGNQTEGPLTIQRWTKKQHGIALGSIALATVVSGLLLHLFTDAYLPFADSFTTWASIVTTYMVATKVLENWLYWLVIDSVSIWLYLSRDLYFTSLLFAIYIIIIFFGWYSWQKSYKAQSYS